MTDTKELRRLAEYFDGCEIMVAADDIRALLDEVEALRKDAGRYRWLRIGDAIQMHLQDRHYGSELDEAIDAALAGLASPQPEKEEETK